MTEPVMTDSSDDATTQSMEPERSASRSIVVSLLSDVWAAVRSVGRGLRAIGRLLLRWRAPLVLLPLLVGLGYSAVLGGRMLFEDKVPAPPTPRSVTCWDGSQAPRVDCPVPDGAAGLQWVFPSFRPKSSRCIEALFADNEATRPTQFDCAQRLQGASVTLSYSQRSTLARGLSYFDKRYPGIEARKVAGGERLVYRDAAPRSNGTFEVTATYTDYPYAVTVGAPSLALADAALDQLVTFRPSSFVVVRPARLTVP